jgi:hypothetical protein
MLKLAFFITTLLIQLGRTYDFNHPEIPTIFSWRIDSYCLSYCHLNVTTKETNQTANFLPNTYYSSCDYPNDYQWKIECTNRVCYSDGSLLYKYTQKTLYATKTQQEEKNQNQKLSLLVITIPQCGRFTDGDCLIVEVTDQYTETGLDAYGEPELRYYGKNLKNANCSHSYLFDQKFLVPYKKTKVDRISYKYTAQFRLDCYSDQYYNPDQIKLEDSYYFQIKGWANVKYYIGNPLPSQSPSPSPSPSPPETNKFIILFGILCATISLLSIAVTYSCLIKPVDQKCSEIKLDTVVTDESSSTVLSEPPNDK